jgi:hypothetical protein
MYNICTIIKHMDKKVSKIKRFRDSLEWGSITLAASKLNVSKSAVNNGIQNENAIYLKIAKEASEEIAQKKRANQKEAEKLLNA